MKINAYAKINWDLHVLGKRPDGFHEVDTVMVRVGLADELTVEPADELSLTCSDSSLPCDASNLIVKAALALGRRSRIDPKARMHVLKRIPAGGGMGGGSADAAAALQALNSLWNLKLSRDQLSEVAAELGSDVAFFLWDGWCRCRGRGEVIEPLPGLGTLPALPIWLIIPPYSVPTPPVFRALGAQLLDCEHRHRTLTEVEKTVRVLSEKLVNHKVCKELVVNDLLTAAQQVEPRLCRLAKHLEELFPGRWRMSGSGAVHFVIPPAGINEELIRNKLMSFPDPLQLVVTSTRAS